MRTARATKWSRVNGVTARGFSRVKALRQKRWDYARGPDSALFGGPLAGRDFQSALFRALEIVARHLDAPRIPVASQYQSAGAASVAADGTGVMSPRSHQRWAGSRHHSGVMDICRTVTAIVFSCGTIVDRHLAGVWLAQRAERWHQTSASPAAPRCRAITGTSYS